MKKIERKVEKVSLYEISMKEMKNLKGGEDPRERHVKLHNSEVYNKN